MNERKFLLTVLILVASISTVKASDANYVGGGRYICPENRAECALVKQNNRARADESKERAEQRRLESDRRLERMREKHQLERESRRYK